MEGENKGPVKDMPDQSKVEEFWEGLWGTQTQYNENAPWLHTLERDYVPNAQQKEYEITEEIFDKVISKMANDKLGKDLTTCIWIKGLRSTKHLFRENLKDIKRQAEMPEWLITTKTILMAKNKETKNKQIYHPIAIQNTMYKIYTGTLAEFIMDHCKMNDVITEEQAAGKRGSWGCTDQLLANKMIYNETKQKRLNLLTVWLDYKKVFDSVPHSWVIKSLELAKVPKLIIEAIKSLMDKWRTKMHLYRETSTIETRMIDYYRGILQGDLPSLILFVLAVNPLSHLLSKEEGFKLTIEDQIRIITHLFFVDNLKLYASTLAKMNKLLDIVTQFTNDVGMTFGESKCTCQAIERGKRKEHNEPLKMKGLTIRKIENGDHYTYLGVDESVGILGPLNKQRVAKEYKTRLQKIWSSELNGRNKTIAHNTFAVPIITPMTKKEVKDLDVMTRKIISMNSGFHTASDVNRLYADRKKGGRGLRSIEDMLESRTIGIM